jgi:hypothetical protein
MNLNEKIPYFKPILSGRLPNPIGRGDNSKVMSNIEWKPGDPLSIGILLITANGILDSTPYTNTQPLTSLRFSITTGDTITKDQKKYYEVYPELYDYEQARVLSSAFKMIKRSDLISKRNREDKTPKFQLIMSELHPFHAMQLKYPNGLSTIIKK